MNDLVSQLTRQVGWQMAAKLDATILDAITARIGPVKDIQQLRGRLVRELRQGQPGETWVLDGQRLLWVGDVEMEMAGMTLRAHRPVKRFGVSNAA